MFCRICGTNRLVRFQQWQMIGISVLTLILAICLGSFLSFAIGSVQRTLKTASATTQRSTWEVQTPVPTTHPSPTSTFTPQSPLTPTPTHVPTWTPTPSGPPPPNTPPPTQIPTPKPVAMVIADKLNVRSGPGTDYDGIGEVAKGDELEVIGRNRNSTWFRVKLRDEQTGWVSGKWISLNVSSSGIPIAPAPPEPTRRPTPIPTKVPAPVPVASSTRDFSGTQGANNWEYLKERGRNSGSFHPLPRYGKYQAKDGKPARNCWLGDETDVRICEGGEVHPGVTGRIAYIWHSPINKHVRIHVHAHKIDTRCGDGIWVGTYTGIEGQPPNKLGEFTILGGDNVGKTREYPTRINQDSYVIVMVDIHGSSVCDQTRLYVEVY